MKYEIYQDKRGEWRWRLKAANWKILAVSSEGYKNRADCLGCSAMVKGSRTAHVNKPNASRLDEGCLLPHHGSGP